MAHARRLARKLCSAAEIALLEASLGAQLDALSPSQLQTKIRRSRRLRDRESDLVQRQSLTANAKSRVNGGPDREFNQRGAQREQLFNEMLSRFEARSAAQSRVDRRSGVGASSASRAASLAKNRETRKGGPAARKDPRASTKLRAGAEAALEGELHTQAKRKPGARTSSSASKSKSAAKTEAGAEAVVVARGDKGSDRRTGKARSDPAGAAGVTPSAPSHRFMSDRARLASRSQKLGASRMKSILGHIRSRARRDQARRDSR